jgi:hypothetical protein
MRMPMCEAAYNGKWEVVTRIHERRLYHHKFARTFIHPQPPPPRIRKKQKYSFKKVKAKTTDLMTCLALGMSEMAAGEYLPDDGGWVGANDEKDTYGIAMVEIQNVVDKVERAICDAKAAKTKSRLLTWDKRRQVTGKLSIYIYLLQ